jgi:predicted lipoprotein with Yx(FWY)xxD motif
MLGHKATFTNKLEDLMWKSFLALVSSTALLFATAALAQNPPTKTGDSAKGKVLTDAKGMTLYTFDKDGGSKSACNGPCATNWPPLMASADAKPAQSYTVISRDDGSKQWAYKGKPLYTWSKDTKPGDVTGDGFNNVWHIATP